MTRASIRIGTTPRGGGSWEIANHNQNGIALKVEGRNSGVVWSEGKSISADPCHIVLVSKVIPNEVLHVPA